MSGDHPNPPARHAPNWRESPLTLVADGRVYDHVRHRARGGIWRYALGKNMWKIDVPRKGRDLNFATGDSSGAVLVGLPEMWGLLAVHAARE